MLRFVSLFGLAAGLCLGQIVSLNGQNPNDIVVNGHRVDANGNITLAATLDQGTVVAGFTSNAIQTTGSNQWVTNRGTWDETRPLDKRGPTLALVKAATHRVTAKELAPAGYIELARSIGAGADEARMLEALNALDLHIYDYSKVDNYLYREALKQGTRVHWVWLPMRSQDQQPIIGINGSTQSLPQGGLVNASRVYNRSVPMEVLQTVKLLLARIPEATPLISDYEVTKPDPFLAVTTPQLLAAGKLWIVAQWDEPGFGGPVLPAGALITRR